MLVDGAAHHGIIMLDHLRSVGRLLFLAPPTVDFNDQADQGNERLGEGNGLDRAIGCLVAADGGDSRRFPRDKLSPADFWFHIHAPPPGYLMALLISKTP